MTPEGWVFLIILFFIGIGAVLRNVNLLILATGILVAPLIFNWRVCVANLRSISARRVVPERVHALSPINVTWTCENIGGRLAARNVVLRDRLTDDRDVQAESTSKPTLRQVLIEQADALFRSTIDDNEFAHICFKTVKTSDPDVVTYQCFFPGRGKYQLGPAVLETSFPFGLVACRIPIEDCETVFVAPPLGQLHPTWERRINSMETGGQSRMRRRGLEHDEFYAMRKWRSGDSPKDIHWRSTARRGVPMVKQYDEPNDRDFAMLLDLYVGEGAPRIQCETILSFAATALEQTGSDVQGQFALAVCGQETEHVAGRQNHVTRAAAMQCLATAQEGSEADLELALIELASKVSSGTPLYCFSTRDIPAVLDSGQPNETSPALKSIQHLIRWVHVGSSEFNELFSSQPITASSTATEEATA
jgi:uncharacterized protein (DUF58 family)